MPSTLTRRRAIESVGAFVTGLALAGCSGDGDGTTVEMTDGPAFEPESITVSVGDTVTWENTGSIGHTVTAYEAQIPDGAAYFASGAFESQSAAEDGYTSDQTGEIAAGETYQHTFETAGTYEYFCIPHESTMKGTVEVQ